MTIQRDMPGVRATFDKESYELLADNWPDLADALQDEINKGARPEEIGRFVMQYTQREKLMARCKQAAGYLFSVRQKQLAESGRTTGAAQ